MTYTTEQQQIIKNVDNAIFGMSIGLHDLKQANIDVILQVCRDYGLLGWLENHPVSLLGYEWKSIVDSYRKDNKND